MPSGSTTVVTKKTTTTGNNSDPITTVTENSSRIFDSNQTGLLNTLDQNIASNNFGNIDMDLENLRLLGSQ